VCIYLYNVRVYAENREIHKIVRMCNTCNLCVYIYTAGCKYRYHIYTTYLHPVYVYIYTHKIDRMCNTCKLCVYIYTAGCKYRYHIYTMYLHPACVYIERVTKLIGYAIYVICVYTYIQPDVNTCTIFTFCWTCIQQGVNMVHAFCVVCVCLYV